ncbi:MAG TPA: aminotransferase class III-fold pyridoxal phosphate-dependent enzyme [Polyangiaceae bacterium]|nr:aminotransferase class III-fold pyridoxal phosphate-dependent enzyme [Polyangiaceae bacterium]
MSDDDKASSAAHRDLPPLLRVTPPGPSSRTWQLRHAHVAAPMGPILPPGPPSSIVYATGRGSNVTDVDGNRYVDLAGGFGALLLGHLHPSVQRVIGLQSERLLQALGDLYPSDAKIGLLERLTKLYPEPNAKGILAQSGSDAVSAALKTAKLATGKPGVLAFTGAYHGLGYGPLAACGLRESYRAPFAAELSQHVSFAPYPTGEDAATRSLEECRARLLQGDVGAVLIEPVLGRGGVVAPPAGFLPELLRLAREHGALFIADEIWTGLGRAGSWLSAHSEGVVPDLICLGKGLGGGLPLSAVLGSAQVMQSWRREAEVVHTATFAGAPLAASAALATLEVLGKQALPERARTLGARYADELRKALAGFDKVRGVRGRGFMLGIDLGQRPGAASQLMKRLLQAGYITSTGGGQREVLVLTPALNIDEGVLFASVASIAQQISELN